jgi:hypothetical protein
MLITSEQKAVNLVPGWVEKLREGSSGNFNWNVTLVRPEDHVFRIFFILKGE